MQPAFAHIAKGQNEFGNLSSGEELRMSQKAKHSLVFYVDPNISCYVSTGSGPAGVMDGCVGENLYSCPGHKFAFKAYFKILLA